MPFAASVLLPLYIYPSSGAWDPLFQMASTYPRVDFTAVINPNSGPGDGALPNVNYTQAIQELNSMNNVRTIGYVATTWCTKSINAVLDEIAVYAGWATQDPSLAMHGIFFDETPVQYSADNVQYMQTASAAVRNYTGLADNFVVHNPGSMPDARYFVDPSSKGAANVTVVFEDTYSTWVQRASNITLSSLDYDHNRLGCLMHSVPDNDDTDLEALLQEVMAVGGNLYLTGTENYTTFDQHFSTFVYCLDQLVY